MLLYTKNEEEEAFWMIMAVETKQVLLEGAKIFVGNMLASFNLSFPH